MFALFDPAQLLDTLRVIGYLGIFVIIFAESGLFFGFFLPGDSLLMSAGILAGDKVFSFFILLLVVVAAAILGDTVGYLFGRFVGKKLFVRKSSFFLRQEHLTRAQGFYDTHGPKAVVLGRFIPIVRTFVPIIAGVASMKYLTFVRYNIIGALVWGGLITSLGYLLGSRVPNIDTYILPCILVVIFISFLPVVFEVYSNKKRKNKESKEHDEL